MFLLFPLGDFGGFAIFGRTRSVGGEDLAGDLSPVMAEHELVRRIGRFGDVGADLWVASDCQKLGFIIFTGTTTFVVNVTRRCS